MRRDSAHSLQLDHAHSVYLLGQNKSALPAFPSYLQLMERCAKEGDFLSFERHPEWLACYEKDAQWIHSKIPLLVFRPHTVANIAPFLRVCHDLALPITTRCGGTGLAGSCVPSKEGIVLLTGHFKKIKEYDRKRGMLCVEPGVSIRQIKQQVQSEGWHFPLSMATEGVAGIAGCLSSHCRAYHQQQQSILDVIDQVLVVDGQGQIFEAPAPLVCGAEGLWGVIIEIKIKLKKKAAPRLEFLYSGSWQEVLAKLPMLRSLHALTFAAWFQDHFYFGIEGENWRLPSVAAYLAEHLPGIKKISAMDLPFQAFLPSQQTFVVTSSVFDSTQLPEACAWSLEQAKSLQLECLQQADVLSGSLHLILQSKEHLYSFHQKIKQFLVLWADFVNRHQGALTSCHGVGMQMRPYMPLFWTEESQSIWQKMQAIFDPKNLFGKERFFV